ncbi:bifunctional diaminohydroxyphosphoribosylaminopyrimidine deaminase/5-amino-6-(5-phosphoribosylamino)uracil reductase RibD [Nesterenkonia sp. NBAIMH1]|uniref:bifunctional diaminohydroxyphosphoribosylaminopyrimidine deaminase/5-amino-6-(5-phosphoribosylamino)uracil reductase RibD n=1 Tax=Nesterenkonia sp. NBAIMH1 TaxID=2600320 RepID=UPI001FED55F7|nr:bifunctional diaminohydroxyphosphoribosylaminopyrimidine deaminase/5-amino-6-(5-phosphoribosylamino)uracil reductase RibD [Nesterenkonia sp. NBAIMH1]
MAQKEMRALGTAPHHAHEPFMQQALDAALQGHRGANPLVGAVLTDSRGAVLSVGHHRGAGSLHAERDCIARAQSSGISDFSGTTLYSTLEPCRNYGRTPACTQLIHEVGIGQLVYGAKDPTANTGGADILTEAGVSVVAGVMAADAEALNHRWTAAQKQGRPFVTVHLAQSLDARIAAADGTSQWITGPESRTHTHTIRQRIDAILVGTNTAQVDDPRLTARTPDGELAETQPLRCVMGRRELAPGAKLTQGRPEGDGWAQLRTRDPFEALLTLASAQHNGFPVRHVLVEGGQSVLSAFVAADLVDEIFAYVAPVLIGTGQDGSARNTLGSIGVETLTDAPRYGLDPADGGPVTVMGDDVCLHLTPKGAQ